MGKTCPKKADKNREGVKKTNKNEINLSIKQKTTGIAPGIIVDPLRKGANKLR